MSKSIKVAVPCLAVAILFGGSLAVRAQETGTQQSSTQAEAQTQMQKTQRESRMEYLSKELNLTDEQKTKLKPILADEGKQMRAVHDDTSLTQDQRREKMKELRANSETQINDILTPEQQKKFEELKAQQKARHEGTKPEEPKQPQL
jgi:Spy/CpxP family protein refolding chaperone